MDKAKAPETPEPFITPPNEKVDLRVRYARCTSCRETFFGETAEAQALYHRFREHGEPEVIKARPSLRLVVS